jgi:hypothetical protein
MLRRASCGMARTELDEGRLVWQPRKKQSVHALWTVLSELKPDSAPSNAEPRLPTGAPRVMLSSFKPNACSDGHSASSKHPIPAHAEFGQPRNATARYRNG